MYIVNIHEAKTHLSAILRRVEGGEDILIAKAGKPIACLSTFPVSRSKRKPGSAKGKIIMFKSFMEPLPKHILEEFEK